MWPKLNEFLLQPCCFPCGKAGSAQSVRVELAQNPEVSQQLRLQQMNHQQQVKGRATVIRTANGSIPVLTNHATIYTDANGNPVAAAVSPVVSQPVTLSLQQQQQQLQQQPTAAHPFSQPVYARSRVGHSAGPVNDQRQQYQMRPPLQMYRFPNRPPPPQPWTGAPRGPGPGVYRTPGVGGTLTLPRQLPASGVTSPVRASVAPAATLPPEYRSKVCSPGLSSGEQIRQQTINGPAQTACHPNVQNHHTVSSPLLTQQPGQVVSQEGKTVSGGQLPMYQQSSDRVTMKGFIQSSPSDAVNGSLQSASSTKDWSKTCAANLDDGPVQHAMSHMQSSEQCVTDGESGFIWDLKAGDLFGKSNEELTLLLLQLRRQSGAISGSQDRTRQQLAHATSQLAKDSPQQRHARLQIVDRCKIRLSELDKQMETTRPLISLVDNMLKLSAVDSRVERRCPQDSQQLLSNSSRAPQGSHPVLTHDSRASHGSHSGLPHCSRTPQGSHPGLSHGIRVPRQVTDSGPPRSDSERLLQQQRALQQELWRVRGALSNSAKSLEETTAENARLERQMGSLYQRLEMRQHNESGRTQTANAKLVAQHEVQCLESELFRVQGLINQLSVKRAHLTQQVLTLSGHPDSGTQARAPGRRGWLDTDVDNIPPPPPAPSSAPDHTPVPLYIDTYQSLPAEGACDSPPPPAPSGYHTDASVSSGVEADTRVGLVDGGEEKLSLDSGLNSVSPTGDSAPTAPTSSPSQSANFQPCADDCADANIHIIADISADVHADSVADRTENSLENEQIEDRQQATPGCAAREKPLEIKTVRIVKRESQLRQKDKTRRPTDETTLCTVSECKNQASPEHRLESASDTHFRRCMSLPRGYERGRDDVNNNNGRATAVFSAARLPQFRHHVLKRLVDRSTMSHPRSRLSAHQRLFGSQPSLAAVEGRPNTSLFRSDAARQIVRELSDVPAGSLHFPQQPRPRGRPHRHWRRHHTISGSRACSADQLQMALSSHGRKLRQHHPPPDTYVRSVDDMCMAESRTNFNGEGYDVTRPFSCSSAEEADTPDVVKSSLSRVDQRFDESTIDSLLGTPSKIHIPERYVPEVESENLTAAEKAQRSLKAASIRKMLTQSTGFLDTLGHSAEGGQSGTRRVERAEGEENERSAEERSAAGQRPDEIQRNQLLQLNQLLAKQVTEKSKHVAVPAEA